MGGAGLIRGARGALGLLRGLSTEARGLSTEARGLSTDARGLSTEARADQRELQFRPAPSPSPAPRPADALVMLPLIHEELAHGCVSPVLRDMATYYFDGQGKAVRPVLTQLMAGAVNTHLGLKDPQVEKLQNKIAWICEMWHTSSLLHDDVIDHAESRRGKESVNKRFDPAKSIFAGDYILGVSAKLLAQTGNPDVVITMSQILADLVNGEFQQMASRQGSEDRFQLYLDKTFNKTASLMAYSCKAVAILATSGQEGGPGAGGRGQEAGAGDPGVVTMAYQYGQNIGIAFQLVDDWLDFVASADQLGKPAGADLSLGLATAPVLFASEQFPVLNSLILRQFSEPGDVEEAFRLVLDSDGLEQTKQLAATYSSQAVDCLQGMEGGEDRTGLLDLADQLGRRCH